MATDLQIAANRANAKKSTGPRTQAGRARSGQNARVHGLAANSVDLRSNPEHQQVVNVLVGDVANKGRVDAAWNFVDAQVKLRRIAEQRSKAFAEFESPTTSINYLQVRRAAALDRYERYAYSQLLRAILKLED
ncbi:hypothetical protein FNL55_19430 [Tardiphaga sp. vice352]|uniref:hypothetical protein n=1 Tax=unclassified Tardiphaga TaxID=2631404 RepID=UPI001163125D|nr:MULTISPECIES: hypothetical protein [unclassified Tardiphaga]QDM28145.1 hypothetical protein FNL56_19950 [Tardiphaga sp. vice304]QDM33288.1 hypothetical protein FNL55_19430 [Tardiphaga sp. vice352]